MTFLDRIYRRSDSVVFRKIGQECILVPIRQGVGDLDSLYTLNETGARIWELLDGKMSVEGIKGTLVEEYDVLPEEVEKDLTDHLVELESLGMVVEEAVHGSP
jgi:hypothetical protein